MLVFLQKATAIWRIKIIGKLTAEDYQPLMDIFYGILNRHGALYALCQPRGIRWLGIAGVLGQGRVWHQALG